MNKPYMSELVAYHTGLKIAELMNMKPDDNGRYATSFGDKTATGLARCVERVMREAGVVVADLGIKVDQN